MGCDGSSRFFRHGSHLDFKPEGFRTGTVRNGSAFHAPLFSTHIHIPDAHEGEKQDAVGHCGDGDGVQHRQCLYDRGMALLCVFPGKIRTFMARIPSVYSRHHNIFRRNGNKPPFGPRNKESAPAGRHPPLHPEERALPLCHSRKLFRGIHRMDRIRHPHLVSARPGVCALDLRQSRSPCQIAP